MQGQSHLNYSASLHTAHTAHYSPRPSLISRHVTTQPNPPPVPCVRHLAVNTPEDPADALRAKALQREQGDQDGDGDADDGFSGDARLELNALDGRDLLWERGWF